jgi:hypothetical protein
MLKRRIQTLLPNYHFWVFLSFFISLLFVSVARFSHPLLKHNVVIEDAKGYYAYLPGLFIYRDLNFNFNKAIELDKHTKTKFTDYRYKLDRDRIYTKYYAGTAIAYSPFFIAAHGISLVCGWDSDGYSAWYHGAVVIASLFYLLVAMLFMGKILDYFRIKKWVKITVVISSYFGTNWFYYATWESGMSHTYSAAIIATFLYFFIQFKARGVWKTAFVLGFLLGFITLIRPSNLFVVAFLPLFFSSWPNFVLFLKNMLSDPRKLGAGLVAFLAVISIQFIFYKIQLGQWFIYAYVSEGFHFSKPHIIDFLFSIRKGFFVYTPLYILSVLGVVWWYRQNAFQAFWWCAVMFLHVYILSSWHMWWYGGTLGTRVMIEYYIFWMLPLAFFLQSLKLKYRLIVAPFFLFFVLNGVLQQHQYRLGIIHWDSMHWQLYKDVFLFPIIP